MSRKCQLILLLLAVTAFTSAANYALVAWFKIQTTCGQKVEFGPRSGKSAAFVAGSSLAADGLAWLEICRQMEMPVEGWVAPGSSPAEWELFQQRATAARQTYVVISAYDLNERFVCDFHADIVPLSQTITALWQSHSTWSFAKRILSQYPLTYVRALFPAVGRSQGIMVGAREKLRSLLGRGAVADSESGPTFAASQDAAVPQFKHEKITDWEPGRTLRNLALIRTACQGRHTFGGPKKLALLRMLRQAQTQGQVIVVVLPLSPVYAREFLTPTVLSEFEQTLADLKQSVPQAQWIRLDQLPALNSNDCFWDLVHLNTHGQELATERFLSRLKALFARS